MCLVISKICWRERQAELDEAKPQMSEMLRSFRRHVNKHTAGKESAAVEYSEARRVALGKEVMRKRRVYLDQKYWNYLRDVKRGCPRTPAHSVILTILESAVKSGRALCPISFLTLHETCKQEDVLSRNITAQVIDELSQRVAFQFMYELTYTELLHWSRTITEGTQLVPLDKMAWTYTGLLMGELQIKSKTGEIPREKADVMNKALFDTLAEMSFCSLMDIDPRSYNRDDSAFLRESTEQCKLHRHEFNTFHQAFLIEVEGILRFHAGSLRKVARDLCIRKGHEFPTEDELSEVGSTIAEIIRYYFDKGKITTELPGISIGAGINAAKRYRSQPFKKGDTDDMEHARHALPYCDMFLTEKNLGNLLTGSLLEYDKLYKCMVLWDDDEIVVELKKMFPN